MNAENPVLTQNPNVTQIPVQEYPPQEGQQQYGEAPQDGQQSYVQETVDAPQDGNTEHYDVPLHEGSEHEHQVEGDESATTDSFNTAETPAVPPSEEQSTSSAEQTDVSQPQEDVDAGRWDHDKAETLAHALQASDEGKKIIDEAQFHKDRADDLEEKSKDAEALIQEEMPDWYGNKSLNENDRLDNVIQHLIEKLENGDLAAWDYPRVERQLDEARELLANYKERLKGDYENSAERHRKVSSEKADRQLATLEKIYDVNPSLAQSLSSEELVALAENYESTQNVARNALRDKDHHLTGYYKWIDKLISEKNSSDFIRDPYDLVLNLTGLYHLQNNEGKSEDQQAAEIAELEARCRAAIDPFENSGSQILANYRAMLDELAPAVTASADSALAEFMKVVNFIKGTPQPEDQPEAA